MNVSQFHQNMGGAIHVESLGEYSSSVNMIMSGSQFHGNTKKAIALLVRSSLFTVSLQKCLFSQNSGEKGAAIYVHNRKAQNSSLSIACSKFVGNVAVTAGAAVYIEFNATWSELGLSFILFDSEFFDNIVEEDSFERSGGALVVSAFASSGMSFVHLKQCRLQNNTSQNYGGALALYLYESAFVQTEHSNFINNTAGDNSNSFGGAFYLHVILININQYRRKGSVQVKSSTFVGNTAAEGGSVFQTSKHSLRTELKIEDTTFACCFAGASDFIILKMLSLLKNTSFYYYFQQDDFAVVGLTLKPKGPYVLDNVFYSCFLSGIISPANSLKTASDTVSHLVPNYSDNVKTSLIVVCSKCSAKPLAVGNSTMHITLTADSSDPMKDMSRVQHSIETNTSCHSCPFGGHCIDGVVKALPNFWGYKQGNLIAFVSCPLQYCCNDIDVMCNTFDACAPNRTGQLCGQCEKGFSESLISTVCIPDDDCDDWWMWPAGFLLAFAYLTWFMFKGNIIHLVKCVFHWFCFSHKHNDWPLSHTNRWKDSNQPLESDENAYFDILVCSVNIMSLIKVQVEFAKSSVEGGILYNIEKKFTKYLDIEVQEAFHIEVCPFPGINATIKTLARPIFTVMVLFVWCLLFVAFWLLMHILICNHQKTIHLLKYFLNKFKLKLVEGFVETVKYSYSGIAGATFMLLTCVKVGSKSFWKFNAEIACYSTVQKLVIVFATIYTIPLVFIPPTAGKLLRSNTIGYTQVMFACILPFPFLTFWIFWYILPGKCHRNQSISFSEANCAIQATFMHCATTHLSEETQVLLVTYQGAYKSECSYWESILEIRKLIFCSFYLVPNDIYRLVLCTFASIIALVHHRSVYPFKHINSNRAETLSLSLICIACVTNGIKSVYPQSGLIVESDTPTEQLLHLMNKLDKIFTLLLLVYIIFVEIFDLVRKSVSKMQE